MESYTFVINILLFLACLASENRPKPLNERSLGLTWEAWLLINDQNQNGKPLNSFGNRITAKSVFIAPNFSPNFLSACAEVHSSDMMGRCIKFIKLDQDAHYEFLIQRLREKYSPDYNEDYNDEEYPSATGPLQVNIPLHISSLGTETNEIEEADIAIILSSRKNHFAKNSLNLDNRDGKFVKWFYSKRSVLSIGNQPTAVSTTKPHHGIESNTEKKIAESKTDILADSNSHPSINTSNSIKILDPELKEMGRRITNSDELSISATKDALEASLSKSPYKAQWLFPEYTKDLLPNIQIKLNDEDDLRFENQFSTEYFPNYLGSNSQVNPPDILRPSISRGHRVFPRKNNESQFSEGKIQGNIKKELKLSFAWNKLYTDSDLLKNKKYFRFIPVDDIAYLFSNSV